MYLEVWIVVGRAGQGALCLVLLWLWLGFWNQLKLIAKPILAEAKPNHGTAQITT
jgi:hypothetical protein